MAMKVQPYYQQLLDAFVVCGNRSGFKAKPDRVVLNPENIQGESYWNLSLKNKALVLTTDVAPGGSKKLSKKLGFAKGEFKILINPREVIKKDEPWNIRESAIGLAYVARNLAKAGSDLLLGVHYDFSAPADGEPHPAHPLFHAQLASRFPAMGDMLDGINADRMKDLPEFRLPTAHMSLPSVLLLVAADNFEEEHFKEFLGELRRTSPFPIMNNSKFTARLGQCGMRSCAWYSN